MRVLLHVLAFFIPTLVLVFLVTGPHTVGFSLFATLCVFVPVALDAVAPAERREPVGFVPSAAWDGLLWVMLALHLAIIAVLPLHVAWAGPSVSSLVAVFLVGNASAQGIVLAHELIHRSSERFRLGGRLLLAGVLYEHFYTEHIRGHHRLVATAKDPATARFGERFWPFFVRTVPAQFASAWHLESSRVRAKGLFDRRHLKNRVLQGLVVGWGAAVLVGLVLGPWAVLAHVAQALFAITMLEGVNFMEHWGLSRAGKGVQVVDSWDAEGGLTYYMLIGLARHGDHHAHASRPFQDLRHFEETAKLPWGYLATTYCAVFADFLLLPRLDAELRRCGLGPYRELPAEAA